MIMTIKFKLLIENIKDYICAHIRRFNLIFNRVKLIRFGALAGLTHS